MNTSTTGILYLYLASGHDAPFSTPAKDFLHRHFSQYALHDLDLSADTLTWQYTHRWLASMEKIILVVDGQALPITDTPQGIGMAKKTTAQLLKYGKKTQVKCLVAAQSSPYYPAIKPFERLNYRVLEQLDTLLETYS